MAYSGTGTQADPYIVDNWADFLTVQGLRYDSYIKWADKSSPNDKVVPPVTVSTTTDWRAAQVDFNGWTFEQITIDLAYSSAANAFNIMTFESHKLYNWHVEIWNVKDCQVNLFSKATSLYNAYFDVLICQPLPSNSAFWTRGSNSPGVRILSNSFFYYSVIRTQTEECNMIVPSASFYNSELYINYKYTGDTAVSSRQSVFFTVQPTLVNSYVGGVIDVSDGSGSFAITDPKRSGGDWVVGAYYSDTIFNIKFLVSENCTISAYNDNTKFRALGANVKSYFTVDNGNNYEGLSSVPAALRCAEGDIKNHDKLQNDNFPFIADDNTRYSQYSTDRSGETWAWRQTTRVNSGIPFNPFYFYPTFTPPDYSGAVDENPYITVFDMETKQDGFTGHGLAVLRPTSCRIVEELNGEFNLTLVHPRDDEGKWQYLLEYNIIKALGQLYVIQKVDEVQTGGSAYVQVYAEHISYTLNDKWLFPPFSITGYVGQTLIDNILALATDMGGEWQTQYGFDISTDISADPSFRDWYDMSDGATPYEMILGSGGFISKLGGELYRDNFTMKINNRMYGALDNAFEIAIGYNLTGIRRTVDLSTFCTYFRGYDVSDSETAYQSWFAVSWDPSTLPRAYPRNIVRSQNFSYDIQEFAEGQLERDTMTFFNQNCAPLISYELNIVDLQHNPDYKEFTNNYRYKVGDKGKVWDERLKSWIELEITHTEKDGITGECTKVVIGTQRSFTRPNGYTPSVPRVIIPNAEMIIEGVPPLEFNSNGDNLLEWYITGAEGGVGGAGDNKFYGDLQVQMYNPNNGQPISGMTSWVSSVELIPVEPNTEYTFSAKQQPDTEMGLFTLEFDENMDFVTSGSTNTSSQITCRTWTTSPTTKYIRFEITGSASWYYYPSDFGDFNLNLGDTQLPYEPYSIALPVTISDGTHSQTVNISIDHPLTENETISRASTEIDIPTYEGDNTLTVNTSVQPSSVKIKYKESL